MAIANCNYQHCYVNNILLLVVANAKYLLIFASRQSQTTLPDARQKGEEMKSNEEYKQKQENIKQLIAKLQDKLITHSSNQKDWPANWGFVGELTEIEQSLNDCIRVIE